MRWSRVPGDFWRSARAVARPTIPPPMTAMVRTLMRVVRHAGRNRLRQRPGERVAFDDRLDPPFAEFELRAFEHLGQHLVPMRARDDHRRALLHGALALNRGAQ